MTPKKIGMIVGAVVAIALAIVFIGRTIQNSQPHDEGVLGGGKVDPNNAGLKAGTMAAPDTGKPTSTDDKANKAAGAPAGAGD
jgi:hypothetical protein